jgi:hypothetical protein
MIENFLVLFPVFLAFGAFGWLMFFLLVYLSFPKMEKWQKFWLSFRIATAMIAGLLIITGLFLYFFFAGMFK